jgi:hypothetical protein
MHQEEYLFQNPVKNTVWRIINDAEKVCNGIFFGERCVPVMDH